MNPAGFTKKAKDDIPKDKCPDSTIKLLTEGYFFIPNRIRKYELPIFQTRIMGKKAVCMSGEQAAKLFYDQKLFTRKGAMPGRIQETLFGRKAIQTLDGAAHMHRKLLFLSLMSPERLDQIKRLAERQWDINSRSWEKQKQIILFDEASKLMFQVACKWAGVPLKKAEAKKRAMDMSFMIDAFGAAGPRHWRGRCARNCSESFARRIIEEVRSGRINAAGDTALHSIAWYKDEYNELLTPKEAAVELINILRPITAIATYITFGALALYRYPECKEKLNPKDDAYLTMFAQEIRRYYPFGPFLGARVRNSFQWYHHKFKEGDLVFLDIYGTNHDKSTWVEPDLFRPERFANHTENPFDFIPQGGGDYKTGTRCPGEWLTIDLLKVSISFLTNKLKYQVPLQDLTYPMNRIPTLPRSKFILSDIRKQAPD